VGRKAPFRNFVEGEEEPASVPVAPNNRGVRGASPCTCLAVARPLASRSRVPMGDEREIPTWCAPRPTTCRGRSSC
jgi:hypothetical protein